MSGEYLLDRERELALIEDSLGRASRGAGRVVVIDGAAGIGKTKLMAACCDRARARGMRVFTARCSELEREFSFGVVQQLFERLVARGSARPVVWSDTATSVAELLNPAEPPLRSEGLPDDNRWAALNALFWLTVDLAEPGPIVIAVDDMQWCDDSSSYFVDYLARRIDGLGVVLVVAARSGETDMSELMRNPAAVVVRPGPLSETASTEVIRAAYSAEPDDAFVDACQAATGGNALLVTELARALASDRVAPTADHVDQVLAVGSGALAQTVTHRLAGLGDDATRLARAAAVLGDGGSCRDA
ncbi:MAG TPA: AAA family ATPase, partial [Actinomycetospora sp.]|nr:AAA family ATPase [Actinomycetospora sp.]